MVSDSRNRSTSARCSDAVHGKLREEKEANGSATRVKAGGELWRRRGRLGDDTGRKNGIALHDDTHGGGEASGDRGAPLLSAVLNRETRGEGLTCGGHV